MKIFFSLATLPLRNSYFATFGNFDGIHLGHQKILKSLIQSAKKYNCQPIIISFSQHTKLPKNNNHFLIEKKIKHFFFKQLGIYAIIYLDFNKVKKMIYQNFIDILVNQYRLHGIVASDKLKIGYQQKGTVKKIANYLKEKHENVFVKILISSKKQGEIVSSTLIRNLIQMGNIRQANQLLYLPFHIDSTIISGKKNGRKINYPTINIKYPINTIDLKKGVYVTLCLINFNQKKLLLPAMTFFGCSFTSKVPLVESYLLDFSKNIYNKKVVIFFLKYLRDKKKNQ